MILEIVLEHSSEGARDENRFFVSPAALEEGADIVPLLPERLRAELKPFTAEYTDDATLTLSLCSDRHSYSVYEYNERSFNVLLQDGSEVAVRVNIMPKLQMAWDMLYVKHGGVSIPFQCEFLSEGTLLADEHLHGNAVEWLRSLRVRSATVSSIDIDAPSGMIHLDETTTEAMSGALGFELVFFSVILNEWDYAQSVPRSYRLDGQDMSDSFDNADAAYAIALDIAEQHRESPSIAAKYMRAALRLGSDAAREWLNKLKE